MPPVRTARRRRAWLTALVVLVASGSGALPAAGYEFEIRSRTIGQAEELRSLRFVGGSLLLTVRRFTQTLSLSIWDIGRPSPVWRLYDPPPPRGARYSFHGYLRLDHDFGGWTSGSVDLGGRRLSAVDVIPELEAGSLQLDVLYAYAAAEGLAGGPLDLYLGRQLGADALDWYAFDGALARVRSRWHTAVEAFGGLQVREASPLGWPELEPDGTSGAECQEYVEGASPGTGEWRPIDLGRRVDEDPFRSDIEVCPQRDQLMPTFGGAVELTGVRRLEARLGYRRAMSPTPGLLGEEDRLSTPDAGLYPNEVDQAPDWGTNQERLSLSVRSPWQLGRRGTLVAVAAARYSLLHSLVDQALLGAQVGWGAETIDPELTWTFPTFDGDSIFNAFSAQPVVGARVTWEHAPQGAAWRTYARGWLRRFRIEDSGRAAPGADVSTGALAAGGQGGARWRLGRDQVARFDLVHEDGYGGRRTGGWATARWRVTPDLVLDARASAIDYASDLRAEESGLTMGVRGGGTYQIHDTIAISAMAEENTNRLDASQLSLFAVLDMAFRPEL